MHDGDELMRLAIDEGERARGTTGDNPWVGCVIVAASGEILARGHTQGPGEDHAEIVALRACLAASAPLADATLYSTLEPCSFHGRTPACARAIIDHGLRRVVTGILDPNPRVDGAGNRILREAGVDVREAVLADEVTRSLSDWIFAYYPEQPLRSARAFHEQAGGVRALTLQRLERVYGVDPARARELLARALGEPGGSP